VAQTTANADAVLREFYLEPMREALNQKAVLMFAASDEEDGPSDTSVWPVSRAGRTSRTR
jgi:hypothetical protein